MRGLDPRIHLLREKVLRRSIDCRVKPGNDDLKLAPMGLDPRVHLFRRRLSESGWIAGSSPATTQANKYDQSKTLERIGAPCTGSNLRPALYKSAALPLS
jgi:hypothetical protein